MFDMDVMTGAMLLTLLSNENAMEFLTTATQYFFTLATIEWTLLLNEIKGKA